MFRPHFPRCISFRNKSKIMEPEEADGHWGRARDSPPPPFISLGFTFPSLACSYPPNASSMNLLLPPRVFTVFISSAVSSLLLLSCLFILPLQPTNQPSSRSTILHLLSLHTPSAVSCFHPLCSVSSAMPALQIHHVLLLHPPSDVGFCV